MSTLRLLETGPGVTGHKGEALSCAYTPDGVFVLSGGWDGRLRLWDSTTGAVVTEFAVSDKAVSACAVAPDGKTYLSGTMQGMLGVWDAVSQQQLQLFLAHTRPISSIAFAPNEQTIATASWDRNVTLWKSLPNREGRPLGAHDDIVAGCRFTPDAQRIVSWGYDRTVRFWDVLRGRQTVSLQGHSDRVTCGGVSPDGLWAATGGRDGSVRLWDLRQDQEAGRLALVGELRAAEFLLDAESLLLVGVEGRVSVYSIPGLQERTNLTVRARVQSAALSPVGDQLALACDDGLVRLATVEGFEQAPLAVTATVSLARRGSGLARLFGRGRVCHAYAMGCPACRQTFEQDEATTGQHLACPYCGRRLRVSSVLKLG